MRKREEINVEIERKGTSAFQQTEILLDIRDLLEKLVGKKKQDEK